MAGSFARNQRRGERGCGVRPVRPARRVGLPRAMPRIMGKPPYPLGPQAQIFNQQMQQPCKACLLALTDQKETLASNKPLRMGGRAERWRPNDISREQEATAIERPGPANRNRAGSATHQANQENTAQAAISGAQTIAPIIEAPIQIPAPAVQSQILKPAQTAETTSATECRLRACETGLPRSPQDRRNCLDAAEIASAAQV